MLLLAWLALPATDLAAAEFQNGARTFRFTYETTIGPIEAGTGPVHVFIPLARSDAQQTIRAEHVESALQGEIRSESRYGNRFWHGILEQPNGAPIAVKVSTLVERRPFHRRAINGPVAPLSAADRERYAVFLEANRRVPVGHPVLDAILSEIRTSSDSDDRARTELTNFRATHQN